MKQCIRWWYRLIVIFAMYAVSVSAANHNPVVFLHGWNGSAAGWNNMKALLVNAGWQQDELYALDYFRGVDIPVAEYAINVYRGGQEYVMPMNVSSILTRHNGKKIDFIVHSMGGLILRQMIAEGLLPSDRVGRVVDLATPHYGQHQDWGQAAEDMVYGSSFLWKLQEAWSQDKSVSQWLNIIGVSHSDPGGGGRTATHDGLVDHWSAALIGTEVSYVNKCHATGMSGETIYACGGDDKGETGNGRETDPVFRLVKHYLETGERLFEAETGVSVPWLEGGGIFLQVVDSAGHPISWHGHMIQRITKPDGTDVSFLQHYGDTAHWGDIRWGGNAQELGITMLTETIGTYRGFDPGIYDIEFLPSPDAHVGSFYFRGVKVEGEHVTIMRITPPTRLLVGLCIDCSGSMSKNSRMENAIASAQRTIDNLPAGTIVEILKFNDAPTTIQPFIEIKDNADGTSNRQSIKDAIGGIASGGGTDILKASYWMLSDIKENDPERTAVRSIILLTDGEDENFQNLRSAFIRDCNEAGVSFNSIAYGTEADARILNEVSERTGGSHYGSGDSSEELDQAFERTVNDILNRVSLLDWESSISGEGAIRTFEVDANTPSVHAVVHVGEGYSVVLRHTQTGRMCTATERSNGTSKTCTFDIADPPAGTWQVVITRTASATADCEASVLAVAPAATEEDAPALSVDVQQTENAVRATVRKGGLVKGARVSASCRVGGEYREIAMSEESPGVYYLDLLACGDFSGGLTVSATATAGTAVIVAVDGDGNVLDPLQEKALSASFTRARHLNISKFSDAAVRNVSVHPRWPWEEKVDVDFDVATIDNNTVLSLELSGVDEETGYQYVVESVSCDEPIGTIGPGRHRLTWDAGKDVPNADFESFAIRFDVTPRAMLAAVTGVTASAGTYFDGVHVNWGGGDWGDGIPCVPERIVGGNGKDVAGDAERAELCGFDGSGEQEVLLLLDSADCGSRRDGKVRGAAQWFRRRLEGNAGRSHGTERV